jgi:hypothetical protein
MNKIYRLVFNKARGMLVAVAVDASIKLSQLSR